MNYHSFKEEINDAIADIEYGVEKVELINDHPFNKESEIAVLKVDTKDNLDLLIKMSLNEGFSLIEYKNKNDEKQQEEDIDLNKYFDSLPNLLMYYSPEFSNQFGLKLFERLSNIK